MARQHSHIDQQHIQYTKSIYRFDPNWFNETLNELINKKRRERPLNITPREILEIIEQNKIVSVILINIVDS